jgi:hypothetical protein
MYELHTAIDNNVFETKDEVNKFMDRYISENKKDKAKKNLSNSPPDKVAQLIMYEAFNATSSKKRISLAKKALSIYDKCCDAYNVLAEESKTEDEAFEYYEKGLKAGEELLLSYEPNAPAGEYWMDIKMRPFLRTLAGFIDLLWESELHEKSIEFAFFLLKLNKMDNQGIRFKLAYRLISLRRFEETRKLFNDYNNDTSFDTFWARFLLNLAENGITKSTMRAFEKAVKYNPTILGYLTDNYKIPEKVPEYFSPGSKEESIVTMINFDPCVKDSELFVKILLVLYMNLKDKMMTKEIPEVQGKDIDMINTMIKEFEDILKDPDKLKEINESMDY